MPNTNTYRSAPRLSDSLPIKCGYSEISNITLYCPQCGCKYPQDNIRSVVNRFRNGITTAKGIGECHGCGSNSYLSMIFRNDGSGKIILGHKTQIIPRINLLKRFWYGILAYIRKTESKPVSTDDEVNEMIVSKKRSGNALAKYKNHGIWEWIDVEGEKYFFDRIVPTDKQPPILDKDEVVLYGCLVYKLGKEKDQSIKNPIN